MAIRTHVVARPDAVGPGRMRWRPGRPIAIAIAIAMTVPAMVIGVALASWNDSGGATAPAPQRVLASAAQPVPGAGGTWQAQLALDVGPRSRTAEPPDDAGPRLLTWPVAGDSSAADASAANSVTDPASIQAMPEALGQSAGTTSGPAVDSTEVPLAAVDTAAAVPVPTVAPAVVSETVSLNARESSFVVAMNRQRVLAGLAPLRLVEDLSGIAAARTADMVSKAYFAHVSPTGESWLTLLAGTQTPLNGGGENLARVSGDVERSVAVAIEHLMDSPTHRANILSASFTDVGVAAFTGDDGVTIFTTIFGSR